VIAGPAGEGAEPGSGDEPLLLRLRDLGLVDLDALIGGESVGDFALLEAFAEDVEHAIEQARGRMADLEATVARGPEPLSAVRAGAAVRGREAGADAATRLARRLEARGQTRRLLARYDDLLARLVPRLFEADRRRRPGSSGRAK
jgi:hypothetical protein